MLVDARNSDGAAAAETVRSHTFVSGDGAQLRTEGKALVASRLRCGITGNPRW